MAEKRFKIQEKGDFEILLGSSPECDYAFREFDGVISSRHASLKRNGDRLFLKDLSSSEGTFVNGRKIGSRWQEITLRDEVFLGKIEFEIRPTLLLGRERVSLEAHDLFFSIPDIPQKIGKPFSGLPRRVLSNHIFVHAEPGTLTAIMGPSGAGKTVLLNLMSGYLRPEQGRVMAGNFNVHESLGLVKDIIGYVPQEDTLIPELTVHQSLHYCLRLGYPDMKKNVRQTLIESVLGKMGFSGNRLEKLLRTKIGSADRRGLSGGERRRVNIAHELVRNPLLLFLDEPTSGLSSVDSEHVVRLLKDVCVEGQVPVLMTIHQPSKAIFDMLDNLLLMNYGGNIAYFGPAGEAVSHFEELTGKKCGDRNPADYVLHILDTWDNPQPPEYYYREKRDAASVAQRSSPIVTDDKKDLPRPIKKKHLNIAHQFFLLLQRNIRIKLADRTSAFLIFFQAVIIALLLALTFSGFRSDYSEPDTFARAWFDFLPKYVENATAFNVGSLWEESVRQAGGHQNLITEYSAIRRASILFLLIASSIWFGVVNASREIVSENATLRRETKGPLMISSYLAAKACVLFIIAVMQTGILLGVAVHLLNVTFERFLVFWCILIGTSFSASSLSLLISAAVRTEQAALMAVPILIIPQLFLGGLIRPMKFLTEQLVGHYHLSDLILQKWAFKAMLLCDLPSAVGQGENVLLQSVNLAHQDFLKYFRFIPKTMADVFFASAANGMISNNLEPFVMIFVHGVVPLLLAYILLKKKYG